MTGAAEDVVGLARGKRSSRIYAGIDAGGRHKGFHVAAVDKGGVVDGPEQLAGG
jgi:hypothetical protein